MDSQHNFEKTTPSKSLFSTVHNKLAHSTFNTDSPFRHLNTHSTPPSRYSRVKNPFEAHLTDRLHTHFFSPSVFKVSSPQVNEKFQWTIDEISSLCPADIDEAASSQYESHEHDSVMESHAQAKIDLYFSDDVAPSPFNQQVKSLPLICEIETPAQNIKRTCDGVAQTVLSLPMKLPPDLENALKPYFTVDIHQEIKPDTNVSLHKKLFEAEEIDSVQGSVESSPPHSIILSPVAPPNHCDLDSRFHSPFKLDECNLSPIGPDSYMNTDEQPAARLNLSGYMSIDNSLNIVPDVDQVPKNESINFDSNTVLTALREKCHLTHSSG